MKNLIAELLIKLAEKEEESKELVAQVEALEIVITAILRKMDPQELYSLTCGIETAMDTARTEVSDEDASLLHHYIDRILRHPRS